jgi:hypothetical protein
VPIRDSWYSGAFRGPPSGCRGARCEDPSPGMCGAEDGAYIGYQMVGDGPVVNVPGRWRLYRVVGG